MDIEQQATRVRKLLEFLSEVKGASLPWIDLVEIHLPQFGLLFYPASTAELGDCEAVTDPSGVDAIHILVESQLYESLSDPGSGGNRARATVAHELGHAVLHVPYLRRIRAQGQPWLKVSRTHLESSRDPESQAWAFAGCLLMPRSLLSTTQGAFTELARVYGVSHSFARAHMARLHRLISEGEVKKRSSLLLAQAAQPIIGRRQ